jgi:hypothetical protein
MRTAIFDPKLSHFRVGRRFQRSDVLEYDATVAEQHARNAVERAQIRRKLERLLPTDDVQA